MIPLRLAACLGLLLTGCSTAPLFGEGNLYETHRKAVLAYESGENARAEALYQALVRAAPNDPETWLRLGNLYARENRPDDAADAYQHALLLSPNDYRIWYNLGIIRQRQAHAAFIQTNQLVKDTDPLYKKTDELIKQVAPLSSNPPAVEPEPLPTDAKP